ncbi:hypothetical protein EHM69_10105 [candidate division KSB1 bacterium]|nr:MAG: hypothetical protein EHM69_10105 [candidate division KSB1 bacterium]
MNAAAKRWLFWTPRIICMLFAAFISLFAFDVFDGSHGFWEMILGFLIHLLPTTFLVVLILIVSWRREWIGGLLFNFLAVFFIVMSWGKLPWYGFAAMSGPLFIVGILFLLNWRYRAELRAR